MPENYQTKIIQALEIEIKKLTQKFKDAQNDTNHAIETQFINKFGTISTRFTWNNLITYAILAIILTLFKINFTSTLPAILIAALPPTISFISSLFSCYKYINKRSNKPSKEKIIDQVLAEIQKDNIKKKYILFNNALKEIKKQGFSQSSNEPKTKQEARNRLKELQKKLNYTFDNLNNLTTQRIIYQELYSSVHEGSAMINAIIYTILIGFPSLSYCIIMTLIINFFFPTLSNSILPNIIFTTIAALGGLTGSCIGNKTIDDKAAAYNEIIQTLKLPSDYISAYGKSNHDAINQLVNEKLAELENILIEIEFLKLKITEFEEETGNKAKEQFIRTYQYQFNHQPTTPKAYDPTEIEVPKEIGPKMPRRRSPQKI